MLILYSVLQFQYYLLSSCLTLSCAQFSFSNVSCYTFPGQLVLAVPNSWDV